MGQIDIHEHDPGGVEHQTAASISRDDGDDVAGIAFQFAQDRFAQGTITVGVTVEPATAAGEPLGQFEGGLFGEGFGLAQTALGPSPAGEILMGAFGPEWREVHARRISGRKENRKRVFCNCQRSGTASQPGSNRVR